jgi:hypothetical protein
MVQSTLTGLSRATAFAMAVALLAALATTALAEVCFGRNVFVGGHRIAPHSARWVKIRTIYGYHGPYGCQVFPHGTTIDGQWYDGPIRRCVWKTVPRSRRG